MYGEPHAYEQLHYLTISERFEDFNAFEPIWSNLDLFFPRHIYLSHFFTAFSVLPDENIYSLKATRFTTQTKQFY